MAEKGTVYFFTGLSGAGKTTLGSIFYEHLRAVKPNVVLMDGDAVRTRIFCDEQEQTFTTESRRRGSARLFRMHKFLADQGIDVVACSINMYDEVREWNRANIENYREIYVRVKMDTLYARDPKKLYSEGTNVLGKDLPYEEPKNPDIIVQNDGLDTPEVLVARIEAALKQKAGPRFLIGGPEDRGAAS